MNTYQHLKCTLPEREHTTERGLTATVVQELTELLHGTYCHVFYDNFFQAWILHWIYFELGYTAVEALEATAGVSPLYQTSS